METIENSSLHLILFQISPYNLKVKIEHHYQASISHYYP
jgi:hypothetical protein